MNIDIPYDVNDVTLLCFLMNRYGSDKSKLSHNGHHTYTAYYAKVFEPVSQNKLRLFELGLGTNNVTLPSNMGANGRPGASLRGWRDFFPNSLIYGADIDRDILFQEDRIKTYYCDQLDKNSIKAMWDIPELQENFDIIIEDGLHSYDANKCFFENSIHKLNKGGVYIIEDIVHSYIPSYLQLIETWKSSFPDCDFRIKTLPGPNTYDNNLIVVKKRD